MTAKNSISKDGSLLLYGDIGDFWDDMDALSVVKQLESINDSDIVVRIHSGGGLITEGLAIYNRLRESKAQVTVHIDGIAASMASVVAMAGDLIIMPENALMMIHKPWNFMQGDAEEMRKAADVLDVFEESLLKIYMDRTNLSKEQLQSMLAEETWLTAQEAIELGFADELSEPIKAAASIDLEKFNRIPDDKIKGIFSYEAKASKNAQIREVSKMSDKVKVEATESKVVDSKNKVETPMIDTKAIAEDAIKAERQRASEIKNIGIKASLTNEQVDQMIDDGFTVEQASAKALDIVAKNNKESEGINRVSVSAPQGAKDAMLNAMMHRADPANHKLDSGRDFAGLDMLGFARASIEADGGNTRGLSSSQIAAKAMTTSDFPLIIADVANKSLRDGYDAAPKTFTPFCRQTTASDFKNINRVQLGDAPDLEKVAENGEFKYGNTAEANESYKVETYGKIIPFSRQLIINDDLDALTNIPRRFGASAAELESNTVWGLITANGNLSDGVALFHNTHKNLGTAGALSETTLAEARKKLRKQTTLGGNRPMNLMGEYLIVPAALEVTALKLLSAVQANATGDVNVFGGSMQLIVEPRLDANSETAWYISASPMRVDTIEYAYLSGNQGVYIETEQGFDVDGMKIKARMDFGAGVIDHRGLFKNAGA